MIRVTFHRRREPTAARCCVCSQPISVGEVYRSLVAVRSDAFERPFVRQVAHDECVAPDPCWAVTTRAEVRRRAAESLAYLRQHHALDVHPGQRCAVGGRQGEVVGGSGKHLLVRLDGVRLVFPFHAAEVVLLSAPAAPNPNAAKPLEVAP